MRLVDSAVLCASFCLFGCDSDKVARPAVAAATGPAKSAGGETKPDAAEAPRLKTVEKGPDAPDPCARLNEAELRAVAKVPDDATVTIASKKFSKTVCDFSWINKGDTGRFSGKVSVGVPPKPFADEPAAIAGFHKAIAGLSKSMTAGGKPPSFEDITDVGDEASWWASFGQLSARKGNEIIYVTVAGQKADAKARLELAKSITTLILGG